MPTAATEADDEIEFAEIDRLIREDQARERSRAVLQRELQVNNNAVRALGLPTLREFVSEGRQLTRPPWLAPMELDLRARVVDGYAHHRDNSTSRLVCLFLQQLGFKVRPPQTGMMQMANACGYVLSRAVVSMLLAGHEGWYGCDLRDCVNSRWVEIGNELLSSEEVIANERLSSGRDAHTLKVSHVCLLLRSFWEAASAEDPPAELPIPHSIDVVMRELVQSLHSVSAGGPDIPLQMLGANTQEVGC